MSLLRRLAPTALTLIALLAAAFFAFGIYRLPQQQREASGWVDHTLEVLERVALLRGDLASAAANSRGFLIDLNADRRARFEIDSQEIVADMAALRALTANDPMQQQALDRITPLIEARVRILDATMRQAAAGDVEGAFRSIRVESGQAVVNQILAMVAAMRAEERRLLAKRNPVAQRLMQQTVTALIGCGMLVIGSGLFVLTLLVSSRRERAQADRERVQLIELQESHSRLEVLNDAGAGFAAELDHKHLVQAVVVGAAALTGGLSAALFERIAPQEDGQTETWRLTALANAASGETVTRMRPVDPTGRSSPTLRAGNVVRLDNVQHHPEYDCSDELLPGGSAIRSYLAAPVISRTGETLGRLIISHPEQARFGRREERLVVGLAGQAATALDNARLFQALRDSEARLKVSEELLRARVGEFQTLADNIPVLCWMAHADGHIHWYNRRWYEYTGTSSESQKGWGWEMVHDPAVLPVVVERWRHSLATGENFEMTFPLKGVDGVFRPFLTRVVPICDEHGKIIRWFGTNVDITQRIAAEQALMRHRDRLEYEVRARTTELAERAGELERSNADLDLLARHLDRARKRAEHASQAKSRFLAGMSHELRTPLNGILGYAGLLRMEGGLSDQQLARVEAMLDAGQHLLEMINSVLDLSQVEADHVELRVTEIDMDRTVRACLDLIRPAAAAKGLLLSLETAPDTPQTLTTDPMRLRQVLANLLGNAVKFTLCGSVAVRLHPAECGTAIRIEVADTGPGIPAERRHRLFQEFERLGNDETTADNTVEGAGLGLALSIRLAALLGGQLGYVDNPGGGSLFWLELPLSASQSAPMADANASTRTTKQLATPTETGPLRVLVVDDVPMNCDIARAFLRAAGHEAVCATDGRTAIALAETSHFDAVLMDVRMPDMDGLEATRRIRAVTGTRGRVPIVALTAQAFAEQVAECRQAGMDSHLAKPFVPEALLAAVADAVALGRSRCEAETRSFGLSRDRARQAESCDNGSDGPACPPWVTMRSPRVGVATPVLDAAAFERTAALLAPAAVTSFLRTIAERSEILLRGLSEQGDLTGEAAVDFTAIAHVLAGSAGMFGFDHLASVARHFERAVELGTSEAPVLGEALKAALRVTLDEIQHRRLAVADA